MREKIELVGGDGEDAPRIFGDESFDVVLCHGVLIYLENPDPLIESLSAIARPGAVISILTKNADALAMRPALEGDYKEALTLFDSSRETNRLGLDTSTDTIPELSAKLGKHGIELGRWYGVRVFTDYLDDRPPGPGPTGRSGSRVAGRTARPVSASRAASSSGGPKSGWIAVQTFTPFRARTMR